LLSRSNLAFNWRPYNLGTVAASIGVFATSAQQILVGHTGVSASASATRVV